MTKTLVDIDDTLLANAMRATGETTKKATITKALEEIVRRQAIEEYLELLESGATADLNDPEVIRSAQR